MADQASSERILLVEDDVAHLRVTARVLARAGREIVPVESGAAAVSELSRRTFDAVLSDIRMPGMTGIQLLRAVRDYDADVQVVLFTGDPNVETAAAAVHYGAFQYLTKPVAPEYLRSAVAHAVRATKAARLRREFAEQYGSGSFHVGDPAGVDAALDRALGSLWIAYQPIVRAGTSAVFAYEALLRTEERTFPHPRALFDAATRANRLRDVGRTVRDRVASDLMDAPVDRCIFMNLHTEDLLDVGLTSPDAALSPYAGRIVLELTERQSLSRLPDVTRRLESLREMGYRIALDDVGGGYAGLSSFAQLEPEFVKLDISLVRDVHDSSIKRRLVQAMVELCHDTDKQVIAEGVETPGERMALETLGCDFLQGFLFARPAREFDALAGERTA